MLLLYSLQSPVNIGQILRTGEQFKMDISIYDSHNVLKNPANIATIKDFSCGALDRHPPKIITKDPAEKLPVKGRLIATCLSPRAVRLPDFSFHSDDTILLGNEYDWLPEHLIDKADELLYIPLPHAVLPKPRSYSPIDPARRQSVAQNGIPNLNVAMTASIISYTAHTQSMMRY